MEPQIMFGLSFAASCLARWTLIKMRTEPTPWDRAVAESLNGGLFGLATSMLGYRWFYSSPTDCWFIIGLTIILALGGPTVANTVVQGVMEFIVGLAKRKAT